MPLTRAHSFAAGCLLLLAGLTSPVFAEIPEYVDRDGVPDTITLVSPRRSHGQVTFSGPDRLVMFSVSQHVSALVATDVDRDGLTDLAGASKRRGLLVWKNLGGHRFVRLRRHIAPRLIPRELGVVVVALEAGGRRLRHEATRNGVDLATMTDDGKHIELPSFTSLLAIPLASIRPRLTRLLVPDAVFGLAIAPRAPPIRSL
jgi:hypothetical protein